MTAPFSTVAPIRGVSLSPVHHFSRVMAPVAGACEMLIGSARSANPSPAAKDIHDRRNRAKDRAHAIGLGEPDPAARSDHADLGRPLDRRPVGCRPDRTDDSYLPALGSGADSHSDRRPPFAPAGLANPTRALGLSHGDGNGRI